MLSDEQKNIAAVFRAEYALNQPQAGDGPIITFARGRGSSIIENIVGSIGDVYAAKAPFNRNEWYTRCLGRATLRREQPVMCESCRESFPSQRAAMDHECQGPAEHPGQKDLAEPYVDPYEGQHASEATIEAAIELGRQSLRQHHPELADALDAQEAAERSVGAKSAAEKFSDMTPALEKSSHIIARRPFKWAGTVSHGTLRPEDLIFKFAEVLRDLDQPLYAKLALAQPDDLQEYVVQLMDALDNRAPEGYHFGTTEGDGSDFGFWENDPDEDDLPLGERSEVDRFCLKCRKDLADEMGVMIFVSTSPIKRVDGLLCVEHGGNGRNMMPQAEYDELTS